MSKNNKKNQKITEEKFLQLQNEYWSLSTYVVKVLFPLMVYTTAFYKDRPDKDIKKFCKFLDIDYSGFKHAMNVCKEQYGDKLNEYIQNDAIKSMLESEKNNDEDYEKEDDVGYGKPPIKTRFQKGNKGNPKGRKSKKNIPVKDLIEAELNKEVIVNENGKKKKMLLREVIAKKIVNQISKGIQVPRNNINFVEKMDHYSNFKKWYNL